MVLGVLRSLCRNTYDLIKRIKVYVLATLFFCLISLVAGIAVGVILQPSTERFFFDPLPLTVFSSSLEPSVFILTVFGQNLLTFTGILLLTPIHLGLGALIYLLARIFYLGLAISWYAAYPGTSIFDGLVVYLGHAVPEFLAGLIVVSTSIWLIVAFLRPEEPLSRWTSFKNHAIQALTLIPLIIFLLAAAALIEGIFSIPLARHYSRAALLSEDVRTVEGRDGDWSIEIPNSWTQVHPGTYDSLTLSGDAYESIQQHIQIAVIISKQNGYVSIQDMYSALSITIDNDQTETLGLGSEDVVLDNTTIDDKEALRIESTGLLNNIESVPVKKTVFFLTQYEASQDETSIYGLYITSKLDWAEFLQPIVDGRVASFKLKS